MSWGRESDPIRPRTKENCLYTISMAPQQNSERQASWKQIEHGIVGFGEAIGEVGGSGERLVGNIRYSQALQS